MSFEQKPNTGALFKNTSKKAPNHPDMRGDVYLDKTFLINQMDKSKGPLVKIALAVWNKTSAAGNEYLSMSASEPYVKPEEDMPY